VPEPLKEVGTHEVEVKLHPEVVARLKVTIAPEA
jgi:ribosomal protein L9